MAASPPRLDWSDPSTLFFETLDDPDPPAGRVGYVFPLAESTDILQRFEALAERVGAETPTLDRIRSPGRRHSQAILNRASSGISEVDQVETSKAFMLFRAETWSRCGNVNHDADRGRLMLSRIFFG